MSDSAMEGEGLRDRISTRGEEALGELADSLLENPVFNQALQAIFGAREIANQAAQQAFKNINVASTADVERLGRRLRAVSDRLEAVEDRLDDLGRDLAAIRKQLEEQQPPRRELFSEPSERSGQSGESLFSEPRRSLFSEPEDR
jgi:hypothetical protein